MQKVYKTAIIGGGAAGLLTAVELLSDNNALNFNDIVILERNDRVGKKLLATGNGQGNLTNKTIDSNFYFGDRDFISAFIDQCKKTDIESYFEKMGIPLTANADGKMYPLSKQASAVLDIIRLYLSHKNCCIMTNFLVTDIKIQDNKYVLWGNDNRIYAENVVVACGGKAGKQFGTDGSSYALLEKLGYKTTKLYPSLVQLKTDTTYIRGLKGLKENVSVTAKYKGNNLRTTYGDILFTDYGVSGNAIFQISSYICDKKESELVVEFLPELSYNAVKDMLIARKKKSYFADADLLCGIINKRIGQAILKSAKSHSIDDIVYALKNFTLKVTGTLGFDYAQVTRGGISTRDFNKDSYESKRHSGLYVVGEMLDIDGECGGYNLTFAFTSAIVSARHIKNKYKTTQTDKK